MCVLQFYRCFQALVHCEAPRRGSSFKSSSKVATKVVRGGTGAGPRRTNDNNLPFLVASLGQPATTVPQFATPAEPTIDATEGPTSDINKPVVVSLEAKYNGWWLATAEESQSPQIGNH